jgi:hypothetical protein
MNEIVKVIIRSWNWPSEGSTKFSDRPNPFNISRKNHLNPTSVYKGWKFLFEKGYVKKLIMLPNDSIAKRSMVILTSVDHNDFDAIISKMNDYYFLEKAQFYKIYDAKGNLMSLKKSGDIIVLEFINSSYELRIKQARLIMNPINKNCTIFKISEQDDSVPVPFDDKLFSLTKKISLLDLSELKLKNVASFFNVSSRTVNRWFDRLLEKREVALFPVFDQSVMSDLSTSVAIIPYRDDTLGKKALSKMMESTLLSNRFLYYRYGNDMMRVLLYYEAPMELDEITYELNKQFDDFALSYRYESYFNDFLER